MKNQLTTIAALPGSGSGCQSALPAEVGKARKPGMAKALSEAKYSKPQNFGSPGFAKGGYIGTASGDPVPPWMGISGFVVKDSTTQALAVLAQVGGVDVAGGGE